MADTRRDIAERMQRTCKATTECAAAIRNYYSGDPTVAGALKTYVDAINANVATMTADMAAFTAAAP